MAIIKTVVDLPLTAALSQKWDIRSAPNGTAIKAVNLVKNKRDTLSKRLGFTPLPKTPPSTQAYTYTRTNGLGLGTYLDNLVIFGQGTYGYGSYNTAAQTINTLAAYSDDLSKEFQKSLLPEVLVTPNTKSFPIDTYSQEVDSAVYQDYIITVWNQAHTTNDLLGDIYYSIVESRTGNSVIPATLLASSSTYSHSLITPRILMVGTWAVILFMVNNQSSPGNNNCSIYYSAANMAAFPTTFPTPTSLVTNVYNGVTANGKYIDIGYDADAVNGDSSHFIMAYCSSSAGTPIIKLCVVTNASGTLSLSSTCTVSSSNFTSSITSGGGGIGVYCDTGTNTAVVAYSYNFTGTGVGVVECAIVTGYPSLPGTATGTSICNAGYNKHFAPRSIGICSLGTIDTAGSVVSPSFAQSWGIFWGTPGTNLSGTGFLNNTTYPTVGGTGYTTTSTNFAYPYTFFASIYSSSGTPTLSGGGNIPRYTFGCLPVSRPFLYGSTPYILVYTPSLLQGSYYLMAADFFASPADAAYSPLRPVASVVVRGIEADIPIYSSFANPQLATPTISFRPIDLKGPPGNVSTLLHINSLPLLQYNTYGIVALTSTSLQKTIPTLFYAEFGSRQLYASSTYGQSLAISGGVPGLYDGSSFAEMSFPYYPELRPFDTRYDIATGKSDGPTFNNVSDVVNYLATYEWVDAQGQRHISARSNAQQINGTMLTVGMGGSLPTTINATVYIPFLGFGYRGLPSANNSVVSPELVGGKINSVEACLYRTQVNGTVYYRVSDPALLGTTDTLAIGSDSTVFTHNQTNSYIDQTIDAFVPSTNGTFLNMNPLLYGDGSNGTNGNLDTFNPPSTPIMVKHKNRIFFGIGNIVWYTKELTPGQGPGVNETSMVFSVGDDTQITGLASMDDKLIIFKRKSIYFVSGDGPDDSGNDDNFTQADPIPTELGCTDFRSIVTTPEGVFFQSDAGYRLLDRSLVIQYTGTAVEDEVNAYPFLTSSVLHPSTNRLIICANASDIPHISGLGTNILTGEWLTRDYVLDAWTTGQTFNSVSQLSGMFSSAVGVAPRIFNGSSNLEPTLHFQSADGVVWRENDPNAGSPLPYEDNGSFISSQLNLVHFKPSDSIDGFSRVWAANVMLYQNDPANVTVTVLTDYGATSQTSTWTPTNIAAPAGSLSYPVQMYLQNQRLKTIELQISDAAPTDGSTVVTGQGILFHGITLDCGAYPAAARINPATRK